MRLEPPDRLSPERSERSGLSGPDVLRCCRVDVACDDGSVELTYLAIMRQA